MNVLLRAVCAATLIAATVIATGCGETFRQVATPEPVPGGNPAGTETEVVLNQCPSGMTCTNVSGAPTGSVVTAINVAGDTNAGNKSLQNRVGSVAGPAPSPTGLVLNGDGTVTLTTPAATTFAAGNGVTVLGATNSKYNGFYFVQTVTPFPTATVYQLIPQFVIPAGTAASGGGTAILNQYSSTPIAFDGARTSVYTANTATDSVTKLSLSSSGASFASTTTTLTLPAGAHPTSISFQYFGIPYTQEYVVNSGATAVCPTGGSLTAITQSATPTVKGTACLGAGAKPVAAWIYKDLSKVFVLDFNLDQVYVINASTLQVTNVLPVGSGPFKAAQSNDGLFIYVLNSDGISIINGQAESVVGGPVSISDATTSLPVDMTYDTNFNDTSANTQINHVWVLHADGTVSVFDGTTPGSLSWITSVATITPAQAAAGAFPTNLALLRDGTWAYVGIGNTDQIVAIDTSKLARGVVTTNATTSITVGIHRTVSATLTNNIPPGPAISATVPVETTTPSVTSVGVSRQGSSSQLSKAYATTQTTTTYFCYDKNVQPTDCANSNPWSGGTPITTEPEQPSPFLVAGCTNLPAQNAMSCPNLYNGTTIVAATDISGGASGLNHPINTVITTLPAPRAVATCDPGNPASGAYDLQKKCPAMIPVLVLGRS